MTNKQLRLSVLSLIVAWLSCAAMFAQTSVLTAAQDKDSRNAQKVSLTITAMASGDHVRITTPASIVQMHVEVYAASGEKLFDQETRRGNVFDWHLQDGQVQRLTAGDYVCVVTVKNIAGRLTQRIGVVRVGEKDVSVAPAETAQLSPQQSQAIGPLEENSSWTIVDGKENQTATVIAHDGADGQITRGRGALSFRLGDFFSGNDREQMRLTEEGNLGIGTAKPEAKLDVAGAVRARQGFMFNDGSTLNVNEKGALILTGSDGTVAPNAAGTGTQNHLAKWLETEGAGTLGDSGVTELANGFVGIGTTNPQVRLDVVDDTSGVGGFQLTNHTNGATAQLQNRLVNNAGAFAYYGITSSGYAQAPILSNRAFFGSFQADTVIWTQSANDILFATNGLSTATERMRIKSNGNVGIGTTTPATKLDVNGNAFVRGSGTFANNVGAADFHIGYGLAAPNTAGSVSRLAIQPYGHTGGPWKFVARDEPTKAYLDWVYGNSSTGITLEAQGNVGIGTATPAQKLTVTGIVQSTSGGFKFPDDSVLTSAGTTYTTYASTMGVLSGAPRSLLQLTSLPADNYMVTVTLLARNLTAGNRTLSCGLTSDAQAPYHVDIANFAYTTLTLHGVSNVSSGSIAINCSVDQGDGITVYDRRLSATKLNNVVVQ